MDRDTTTAPAPVGPRFWTVQALYWSGLVLTILLSAWAVRYGWLLTEANTAMCAMERSLKREPGAACSNTLMIFAVLGLATAVLPVLFSRWARRARRALAPWPILGRLLVCLAGYVPTAYAAYIVAGIFV